MLFEDRYSKIALLFKILIRFFKISNSYYNYEFPLNKVKKFKLFLLNFKNEKNKYFIRLYENLNHSKVFLYNVAGLANTLAYEIFKSKKEDRILNFTAKHNGIIFFSSLSKKNKFTFFLDEKKVFEKNINNLFNYSIKFKKSQKLSLSFKKNAIFSKKFYFNKGIHNFLNLVLFVDGLSASEIFKKENIGYFSNTMNFFSNGLQFKNNFSNGEWSLPVAGNFFTGCYLNKHKIYHPYKNSYLSGTNKNIAEVFSENNFSTFKVNSSGRIAPSYGFIKGFDRCIYKHSMHSEEVINHFIEYDNVIRGGKFIWLTFFDLHALKNVSKFDKDTLDHYIISQKKNKSPFEKESELLKTIFFYRLKSLDDNLYKIYNYILKNYSNEQINIHLISDHGQSYFDKDENILKDSRIKTPWFIKSSNLIQNSNIMDITENVDFFSTMLKQNNILNFDLSKKIDGKIPYALNGEKKDFAICQSLYPNQTYKMRVDFNELTIFFETLEKTDKNCDLINFEKIKISFNKEENIDIALKNKLIDRAKKIYTKISRSIFLKKFN